MGSLNKPHAVLIPYPAQGHINPFMQLAKLLHSRGFYITFVNTEFNHDRFVRTKGPDFVNGLPDLRFETISDGLPASDPDATQDIPALCDSARKYMLGPLRELLAKLKSSIEVPPVTCIISDGIMSFAIKAAEELGVPEVQFWTASACGFMCYYNFQELIRRGIVPFKNETFLTDGTLDTPIDWLPGLRNMRLKDIVSFIRTTDPNDVLLRSLTAEGQDCFKSTAMIFNTFHEFEHEVLNAIAARFPNIYTIGPLSLLEEQVPQDPVKSFRSSLWKEDSSCLQWLNKREPKSVVYVNYGSIAVMSDQHFKEFAWGLANSKYPFLWILRPDVVKGSSAILPEEYFEEIKDRGLLATWCPQDKVIAHSSIGAFLTHGGWNSTLESICGGVPVMCWPFFGDQLTNCRYLCKNWGTGLEVSHNVKREEVEGLVKEVMEGEKGKEMKKTALDWKRKAEESAAVGGSSYNNFNRFLKEVLHQGK